MSRSLSRLAFWTAPLALLASAAAACGPPPPPEQPWQEDRRDQRAPLGFKREPPPPHTPPPHRTTTDPSISPTGDQAALSGTGVHIRRADGVGFDVDPSLLHAPAGDRTLLGISPTTLLYLRDGTLLVGAGDGTVTALDSAGQRLFSVGFHGAIHDLVASEGLVAVTTDHGVLAVLEGNGTVRWERQITAEPLSAAVSSGLQMIVAASQRGVFAYSLAGSWAFTHASPSLHVPCLPDERECHENIPPYVGITGETVETGTGLRFEWNDTHPPVPDLTPTFPLTFRKVLDGTVVSLVPRGSTEVWALVTHRARRSDYEWDTDDKYDVVQLGGATTKRLRVPDVASKNEVFVEETKAAQPAIFVDALVQGPNGNPWVLARKINAEKTLTGDSLLGRWGGAGQIFEVQGGALRERTDLFKTFTTHWLSTAISATPTGTASLLCFGDEDPTCAVYGGPAFRLLAPPDKVRSLSRIGDAVWLLTEEGNAFRADAKTYESFDPVSQPADTPFRAVAGVTEKDVWASFEKRYVLLHHDGATWKEVGVPVVGDSLVARAPDDAWSGRSRWDGQAWSLVHGAPNATAILARGKDDVWLGDASALWHGTAPGPSPVQLAPIPAAGDAAAPASAPLPLGPAEAQLVAERVSIAVPGEASLGGASNVTASADGVLWMLAPDRVVEVGGSGKGTTVRWTGREHFGKWAVPEAKGRGLLLHRDEKRGFDHRDEVRFLDGNTTVPGDVQLDRQDAVAVSAQPGGVTWILGAPADFRRSPEFLGRSESLRDKGFSAWEDFAPHALVRTGKATFRPVLGLPAAAWCDVAAAADGGAWFAGALSEGPSGEGILVHARGALGAEGTARFRAAATLFAVAAIGPDEAWAVGAGGTVIHVKGASVTRYQLPSGEWLRSVFAPGPDDVWIGGDGGTLLHHDGRTFHPVTHPLGPNAALTGIASARGEIWAVGPAGILKIKKRP